VFGVHIHVDLIMELGHGPCTYYEKTCNFVSRLGCFLD